MRVPLLFSRNRPENHSHNLGKALAEGLGLLKTGSLSLSLSLSPHYPFHLSIPFTSFYPFQLSLSLSPLYPFHLSIPFTSLSLSLYLSLLSLPPSLYLSFYLSFSLSPSLSLLSIFLSGVSNGRFRPCYSILLVYYVLTLVISIQHFNNNSIDLGLRNCSTPCWVCNS